jgi:flavin reductase (DIM6/NTAB) family NADH-FMN oxidoreductase RutF
MKKNIGTNGLVYPMAMTLICAEVDGKPNFLAAAWVSRVNYKPPLIAMALGPHHTNKGIIENKEFSINIPSEKMMAAADYCGLVSGKKTDKSNLFATFKGTLAHAPMIEECPLTMECRLMQTVKLGFDDLYIGEIVGVYCEEQCLTDGNPDAAKMKPFMLTMPDNSYWALGKKIGQAWQIGKDYKK